MNSNKLNEFQGFLLSNRLVSEKHITFYAHWASNFLEKILLNTDVGEKYSTVVL